MYDLTKLKESIDFGDIIKFVNDVVSPVSVLGILSIALFFIILMIFIEHGFVKATLTSSTICFLLTIILVSGGFVPLVYPFMYMAILCFTFLFDGFMGK